MQMKAKWIAGAIAAATLAVPVLGQVGIYIGRTPPAERYERRYAAPGEGYTWVDGYWGVQNNRYVWVPGRWQQPPYPGAYWSHPHYDHYDRGWRLHEGHWDREDHGYHDDDRDRDHDRDHRDPR